MSSKFMNLKSITAQIDILKHEIQIGLNGSDTSINLEDKKAELNRLMEISKDITKKRLEMDYKKVSRFTDTLEYSRVSKKENAAELLKTMKDNREKATQSFNDIQTIEENYTKNDSKLFPSYLFLDETLLKSYSICPFIQLENDTTFEEKRRDWLSNQHDSGQIYYDLYNRLYNKCELQELEIIKTSIETFFENVVIANLDEKYKQLFNDSVTLLGEYFKSAVKTKKMKEKYKIVVNNLSLIYLETGIELNKYLSEKFSTLIPINNLEGHVNINTSSQEALINIFNDKLEEYIKTKDFIQQKTKYINNTVSNLKQNLYQFVLNKQRGVKQNLFTNVLELRQYGKYTYTDKETGKQEYKKWSELKIDEINERFDSFVKYYVHNYLLITTLIDETQKERLTSELYKLLTDDFANKKLKFKNIKWNNKMGFIEKITNLKFDDINKTFELIYPIVIKDAPKLQNDTTEQTETQTENQTENQTQTQTQGDASKKKGKRPSSAKSIFTKDNEKMINEQLIRFILKYIKGEKSKGTEVSDVSDMSKLKEHFLEQLKLKLKLKRIGVSDKTELYKKFDDIYSVIISSSKGTGQSAVKTI
jgi:hypothetical protein